MASEANRLREHVVRLLVAAEALEGIREVVVDGCARGATRHHLLEQRDGVLPAPLAEQHQAAVERRQLITGSQLVDSAELADGLVEHTGLVERNTEVSV